MKKEIVLLVRSVKRGQYCVAGREISRIEDKIQLGEWIRPVSNHDEGAVNYSEISYENGTLPNFLDIVKIPLIEKANDQNQPENWSIKNKRWKKTGSIDPQYISVLEEYPENLWLEDFSKTDRITPTGYQEKKYHSSLHIIRPTRFSMVISTVYNDFSGREQKRRRAVFSYRGIDYDLAITDPDIHNKYFEPFPGINDSAKTIMMVPQKCLLCVSLAPEFGGYHYKLVANVIEHE